ncbi:expressed unknown protein [Seminavis robusta]|uniref:CRAL-TRIO domain-containing protein n=1 Tax=Seminavis robusta TaxID=568900 RepID=A0A9N8HSA8_9STRA|nr:expressed unknown protein [Seminavis robusta]|eukprot:Sro1693_g291660.1 n/a (301) ;mRNA; r:15247-16277
MTSQERQEQQRQAAAHIDLWVLNEEELEGAWALKIAVEADDEVDNLSDFEYVHQAIFARENTEVALARVRGLQAFRQHYKIHDTPEEGVELVNAFMNKHPGFLLSVDIDETHGHYVMIYDYARRKPHEVKTEEDWRGHLGGMYYLMHALQNNIHACREGIVHICECEGMGWENFSYEGVTRNFSHLYENYPMKHKELSWLRTPMVGNILYSFIKPMLGPEVVRKFHLGCTFNGYDGRLDEIFLTPNAEVAKQNLLQKVHGLLSVRYQVEQAYKLPDLPLDIGLEEDDDDEEDDEDFMDDE